VKADRVARRQLRRMTQAQRDAYERLRWHPCGPAERARLKRTLGWKRSREETIALALELRAEGRSDLAIADDLGVGDRYLTRLLDQVPDSPELPRNPSAHAAEMAPTCETNGTVPTRLRGRQMYASDAFAYDLEHELRRVAA
jgi:hypothetical protein